jgi:hypothetical protein
MSIYVYGPTLARNKGMRAFVSHWRRAVDVDGDYVEK